MMPYIISYRVPKQTNKNKNIKHIYQYSRIHTPSLATCRFVERDSVLSLISNFVPIDDNAVELQISIEFKTCPSEKS